MIGNGMAPCPGDNEPAAGVRRRYPRKELAAFIAAYHFVEITGPPGSEIEDLLYPDWGSLRFRSGEDWDVATNGGRFETPLTATLFGPTSRARLVRGRPGVATGVRFTPQGWAHLIGTSAARLAHKMAPAATILSGVGIIDAALAVVSSDDERVELLDSYFGARLAAGTACDPRIGFVAAAVREAQDVSVEELACRIGMTSRQLARASQRWFGFPTKILLRRQRFLRTLAILLEPKREQAIGQIVDQSYYDQSHFNREFRYFMGMSPRAYFARPRSILRLAVANRMREVGPAPQRLQSPQQ